MTALLAISAAPPALAQDTAAAESLFQAGRKLIAEGKYEEACPKFEESYRQNPLPGTSLNLANCYKQIGKTASAWAQFKEAAFQARKSQQPEREAAANAEVAALEPRLSKLQINAADTPGMVIRRDGKEIGKGALGSPFAVDPGPHTLEATAPGYSVWSTTVIVGKDGDLQIATIPILQKSVDPPRPGGPVTEPAPSSPLRPVAFAIGGVGAAGIVVGSIFGGLAIGDTNKAKELCPNKVCAPGGEGRAKVDAASTKALISTLGIGVGAAALATGVVLFVVSGSAAKKAESAARLVPTAGPDGGGITLLGRF